MCPELFCLVGLLSGEPVPIQACVDVWRAGFGFGLVLGLWGDARTYVAAWWVASMKASLRRSVVTLLCLPFISILYTSHYWRLFLTYIVRLVWLEVLVGRKFRTVCLRWVMMKVPFEGCSAWKIVPVVSMLTRTSSRLLMHRCLPCSCYPIPKTVGTYRWSLTADATVPRRIGDREKSWFFHSPVRTRIEYPDP